MPCKQYKDALIEAAASGAEPQGDLHAHLAGCADCRSAFEQERSLFASIDAGLHVAANAEVPVSLLPRVRARINLEAAPQRSWFQPVVFAAASVALVFAAFLFARSHHSGPDNRAKQTPQIPVNEPPTTNGLGQNSVPGTQIVSSNANHPQPRGHATLLRPVASSQPEVLVPADEREAFARFVAVLGERREVARALVTPAPQTKQESAGLEPLQIKELEIKTLEERQTEISDGAVEKQ
jgi:hypothetical protein